jgi:uncharacterized membrane protein YsdA (DUF1294 family)
VNALDQAVLVWLAVSNLIAFLLFGWDKFQAGRSGSRVSERLLILAGALGGWPGGWIAMQLFRHKTAKAGFRWKYGLGLVPWATLIWLWRSR